jgi:hypothetical protein
MNSSYEQKLFSIKKLNKIFLNFVVGSMVVNQLRD